MRNFQKIKKFKGDIEPNEIFLDRLAQEKEGDVKRKLEVSLPFQKFLILGIIFFILFSVLIGKTFELQILKGEIYLKTAKENTERIRLIQPARGIIYDQNMEQLVFNKPAYDLVCDKKYLPQNPNKRTKLIEEVAEIIEEDPGVLLKTIEESNLPEILISENLSHEKIVVLETKINEWAGFRIEKNTVRDYVSASYLSHLMGFTRKISEGELKQESDYSGTDYIGKTGLEKFYEKTLRGNPGVLLIERDALGQKKQEKILSQPIAGNSLVLSLDSKLQKKIKDELEKSIKRVGAQAGAAVALDPNTGKVLSLISLPSFDNNLFSQGISREEWEEIKNNPLNPLFNRAVSGIGYPTGSVIKPIIALAALEEGIITENTKIYSPLEICIWNRYLERNECFEDWTFHGLSDVKRAIAESVNTFFYIIGGGYEDFKGLGAEKIVKYLELFNWGNASGIDLPEEGEGILPEITDSWRLGDTYHLAIGQGYFSVTPLEVAIAFSAIANGGQLFKPYFVEKIIDSQSPIKVIKDVEPEIIRDNFINPQNIEIAREGMRQAVRLGSATLLNDLPVKAAAKTGTAQSSKEGYYHHWVTVFAPYENPPAEGEARPDGRQIVLTIVIENVKGIQSATLPVAKEVLEWYFK